MIPIDIHLNLVAGMLAVIGASVVFGALVAVLQRNWERNATVIDLPATRRESGDEAGHAAA